MYICFLPYMIFFAYFGDPNTTRSRSLAFGYEYRSSGSYASSMFSSHTAAAASAASSTFGRSSVATSGLYHAPFPASSSVHSLPVGGALGRRAGGNGLLNHAGQGAMSRAFAGSGRGGGGGETGHPSFSSASVSANRFRSHHQVSVSESYQRTHFAVSHQFLSHHLCLVASPSVSLSFEDSPLHTCRDCILWLFPRLQMQKGRTCQNVCQNVTDHRPLSCDQ